MKTTTGSGLVALASAIALTTGIMAAQTPAPAPKVSTQVKVGAGLYEIAVGETGAIADTIYVASSGDASVYVLDAKTLAVKSKISMPGAVAYGLSINNRTATLYTTNTRAGSVSAIDLKTGTVVATIKSDEPNAHVFRSLVDEENNLVYVSLPGSPSKIWVIDGRTNTLAHVIQNTGARSTGLALDVAGKRLYTTSINDAQVLAIDTTTREVVNRFPSGGERPTHVAIDTKTDRLWVTHQGSGNVTVLEAKTGQLLKTVPTGAGALGVAFEPRANRVFVANRMAGTVTVIDAATYAVVADLKAGTLPNTVALDSRTGNAYVTNKAQGRGRGAGPAGAGRAGREGGAAVPGGAAATAGPAAPPAAPAVAPQGAPTAPPPDEGGDTVTLIAR